MYGSVCMHTYIQSIRTKSGFCIASSGSLVSIGVSGYSEPIRRVETGMDGGIGQGQGGDM